MKNMKVMLAVLTLGLGATQLEARGRVSGVLSSAIHGDDRSRQRGYEPVVNCPQGKVAIKESDGSFTCVKTVQTTGQATTAKARRRAAANK
jgi:hypothetical protein